MIDIEREQLYLLTKASANVPGHPHVCTLLRWALRGVKGVKLDTVIVGGRRFTSAEAIRRFLVNLNEPGSVTNSPLPRMRQAEIARAEKQLDKEGIK